MITLCLLLCACGATEEAARDRLAAYREMSSCEMTAVVTCEEEGLEWSATLRANYAPNGETRVEVLDPPHLAGVRAIVQDGAWTVEYGDLCLNAGAVSGEEISPAATLPRVMDALRGGWLLEENDEAWDGVPCTRLLLDQSGERGGKIETAVWLKTEDGTPLRAEIAVDGETFLTAEFTDFTFCDTIEP